MEECEGYREKGDKYDAYQINKWLKPERFTLYMAKYFLPVLSKNREKCTIAMKKHQIIIHNLALPSKYTMSSKHEYVHLQA